jgi:replicative DNA helicase
MTTLAELLSEPPPHDLGCERALIGAVLCGMDPLPPLDCKEFFLDAHQRIWAACQELEQVDGRCTLPTVAAQLDQRGELGQAGGLDRLCQCLDEGCTVSPITGLARIIRERARQRAVIHLGAEMMHDGYRLDDPLADAELQRRVAALPGPLVQAIWDPEHTWQGIRQRWGQDGIRTGWAELDGMTGDLWPGELVIVAGRTSHGKTAFAAAAAVRMALREITVDVITLEDPVSALTRRLIANLSGIAFRRLRVGDLSDHELAQASAAVTVLKRLPVHVTGIDQHGQASEDGVLGLLAQTTGTVVIIDHLQRIWTKDNSRAYGLERVLARIHGHVQRTGQVAWINCQLNRLVETRKDGRPVLADLRDSGAIEILARQVWLLSWPMRWDSGRDWRDYQLDIAKNSEGRTGFVPFRWDAPTGRFWTAEEGPPDDLRGDLPAWVTD